mmetsp:Transcript_17893/g.33759  ORF Transcript_17893/g.33759 Transcript_17893/m.33759 type:complete len:490 (+) Transcript_17893:1758-3227(+)
MSCPLSRLFLTFIVLSYGAVGIVLLQDHASIEALAVNLRPKSRLKPRHEALFTPEVDEHDTSRLFNQLGRLCCRTGVVSRKEFLETYAAASAIHTAFPDVRRVADLASGHGLLGWFLLALAGENNQNRTVICVDRCMPPAAQRIASVMQDAFPLAHWTYVQGDLNACRPHYSCLLTSVHACGSLTDDILQMAIAAQAPCAVVPCCHSVRPGAYRPHSQYAPLSMPDIVQAVHVRKQEYQNEDKHMVVANVVDRVRVQTLQRAGFDVQEMYLEDAFTARNHLLLATPPPVTANTGPSTSVSTALTTADKQPFFTRNNVVARKERQRQPVTLSSLSIPLEDCPDSIAYCQALSGKERAQERLVQQIPRHFSFTLALSIWMDPVSSSTSMTTTTTTDDTSRSITTRLTLEDLQTMVYEACGATHDDEDRLQCLVERSGPPHVKQGRRSQLYKFQYTRVDGQNMSGPPRIHAKSLHHQLRERIRVDYGEDVLR